MVLLVDVLYSQIYLSDLRGHIIRKIYDQDMDRITVPCKIHGAIFYLDRMILPSKIASIRFGSRFGSIINFNLCCTILVHDKSSNTDGDDPMVLCLFSKFRE